MIHLFGESFPLELLFGLFVAVAACLAFLRFTTVLFLTLLCLSFAGLAISDLVIFGRIFRWAFIGGLVLKGLLGNVVRGIVPRPVTFPHLCILALGLLAVGSFTYSIGSDLSLAHGLAMAALWVGVFVVVWNYWRTEREVREFCNVLYLLACVLFGASAVYILLGFDEPNLYGRYGGIFRNPNGAGQAVAAFSPFVYLKFREAREAPTRALNTALALLMIIVLYRSGSRSGILATILCMGAVLAFIHRIRLAAIIPFALVLIGAAAYLGGRLDEGDVVESPILRGASLETWGDRIPLWEEGLVLFRRRPVLGHGFGTSRFADIGFVNFEVAQGVWRVRGANYHNAHLQLAIDLGVLGVGIFWVFLLVVFRRGFRILSVDREESLSRVGAVFFGAFVALFADTFVHGWAFSPGSSPAITFWIIAAAVVRVDQLAHVEQEEESKEQSTEILVPGPLEPVYRGP